VGEVLLGSFNGDFSVHESMGEDSATLCDLEDDLGND